MKRRFMCALACAATALHAWGGKGDFTALVDSPREVIDEDAAVMGFVMLNRNASNAKGVGAVGRAFSASRGENNTVQAVFAEAINLPGASGHVLGIEAAAANLSHDNVGVVHGIDVVFKNRGDGSLLSAVPLLGENRYNENSVAVEISSQPRSPVGEYSGWQTGIKFARWSLDRSVSEPYAVGIDFSAAEVPATFYLMVWRCGHVKCGLLPTETGFTVVRDIERMP